MPLDMTRVAALPNRKVIRISGDDRVAFLQGLVSNDVAAVTPTNAVWAGLLSPQGKWLADFFILTDGECLLLDAERAQVAMLTERLSRFRLRSKVRIDEVADLSVYAAWDGDPAPTGTAALDPRLQEAGWRVLTSSPLPTNAIADDWDLHRLALGLPDGSRDLEQDKTILLEAGFDELNGISWGKGCYMGQELTARTKYRGLVKRRLVPVQVIGPVPTPGTPVHLEGAEVGVMRSGRDGLGLAVIRIDALTAVLTCGGSSLTPRIPAWMRLPERLKAG